MHTGTKAIVATMAWGLLLAVACSPDGQEGVAATTVGNAEAVDFFVAPHGNDHWSGQRADPGKNDGPFATVARAREAVRALLKTRKEQRRVRVILLSPEPDEEIRLRPGQHRTFLAQFAGRGDYWSHPVAGQPAADPERRCPYAHRHF